MSRGKGDIYHVTMTKRGRVLSASLERDYAKFATLCKRSNPGVADNITHIKSVRAYCPMEAISLIVRDYGDTLGDCYYISRCDNGRKVAATEKNLRLELHHMGAS